MELTEQKVKEDITTLKSFWSPRNKRFKEWYEILTLVDNLATNKMESYASNEPQTFYNMAHYLLTKGELSHDTPLENETALELDRRAKVGRGCQYMWSLIDTDRKQGGSSSFVDELAFYLLVLGWYSTVAKFNKDTGTLQAQVWSPYDTFPRYNNNRLASCVHSYEITIEEAGMKAEENNWNYSPTRHWYSQWTSSGRVILDDYFYQDNEGIHNIVFIDSKNVTGWVYRPDMKLFISPVGGFPDKGSLSSSRGGWKELTGRGIFEVNSSVTTHFNKWKSQMAQILRDTSSPITQEFSASPQATPEQLRERGGLYHYAPGEQGLQRLPPAAIPIELQAHLMELRREMQKGSFNDAVYGMVEGQPGYALSLLSTSSANQILYPYMDAKHFVISENDKFWLSNLKTSGRVFQIKGRFIEKLKPTDVPEDVFIIVDSDVATPKDWMERGTIAGLLRPDVDTATLLTEVYGFSDPQAIKRRKSLDRTLDHPVTQLVEMASGFEAHADYLEIRGDRRQAARFRRAAQALDAQIGVPPAGSAKVSEAAEVQTAREAGAPEEVARVRPEIAPPESRGFTPQQLRQSIGRGSLRTR